MSNDLKDVYAVVLCGGKGQRLRSAVSDRPKPMAEVAGVPFLDLVLTYLKRNGLINIVLCTGYMGKYIKDYYTKNNPGLTILFSHEKIPLGTAGAIKHAQKMIGSKTFFVINGDSISNAKLSTLYRFHRKHHAIATILLSKVKYVSDFGSVSLKKSGEIVSFNEKIAQVRAKSIVNAGIYIFDRNILAGIPGKKKCSLEIDVFPKMQNMYGYISKESFTDIGTKERLDIARKKFSK